MTQALLMQVYLYRRIRSASGENYDGWARKSDWLPTPQGLDLISYLRAAQQMTGRFEYSPSDCPPDGVIVEPGGLERFCTQRDFPPSLVWLDDFGRIVQLDAVSIWNL